MSKIIKIDKCGECDHMRPRWAGGPYVCTHPKGPKDSLFGYKLHPDCPLEDGDLVEKAAKLHKGLVAVKDLIDNSYGVTGLHLNGDVAPWDSLLAGGEFESWLRDFSDAIEGGYDKGVHDGREEAT